MKIDLSKSECEFLVRALSANYAETEADFEPGNICDHGQSAKLISKFLQGCQHEVYEKVRKNQYDSTPVNETLFLGMGNGSTVLLNRLHRRLQFAACQLGGMQQTGGMGTEYDKELDRICREDIKSVVRDIIKAFYLKPEDLLE